MKLRLTIQSCYTVSLTIPDLLTVRMQSLLCWSWVNIPTLTYKTQLASILSISCDIQHLAQQHCQHKLQWAMLWKSTYRHFRWANMANRPSSSPNNVINRIKERPTQEQTLTEPLGHCAACNPKRHFQRRYDKKRTSYAIYRKRNGSKIVLRDKRLWQ